MAEIKCIINDVKAGKSYQKAVPLDALKGKKIGEKVDGKFLGLDGYELEITGTSDFAGFTGMKGVSGIGLKGELLSLGKAMHKPPKGDKKKPKKPPQGLRIRKTVRGEIISDAVVQINTKVVKEGAKKLSEVFPDQNKKPEAPAPAEPEGEVSEKSEPKEAPKTEEKKPETPEQEKSEQEAEKPKAKEAPNEAAPEQEPKESEASKAELAHPDEEPKA